jgi:hypothetical protein
MAAAPTTIFRRRKWLLIVYLVFGLFIAVQGIASAIWFATAREVEGWLRPVSIGLALFLVWLGYFFAAAALRRLRSNEAPITISAAGLHDRAVSARPIPWTDIRDLHVWDGGARGGKIVVFDLTAEAAERAGVHARVRVSTGVNRPFGYGYRVNGLGTDASVDRLIAAIAPYAEVKSAR